MLVETVEKIVKWTQHLPSIIKRKSEPPKISLPYNGVLGYHYGELSEDTIKSISLSTAAACDEFQFSPLLTLAVCFLSSGFYPSYHKINVLNTGNQTDWLSYRWGLGGLSPEWFYSSIRGSTEDLLPLLLDPMQNLRETVKRLKKLHNEDLSIYNRKPVARISLMIEAFFNDNVAATKQKYLDENKNLEGFVMADKVKNAMDFFLNILDEKERAAILDIKRFPYPTDWIECLVVNV